MLTAWGFAGLAGPTLIAYVRQTTGHYIEDLDMIAAVMVAGAAIPFMIPPRRTTCISSSEPHHGLLGRNV